MNLTVGPLPPAVYWRRRAIVLGGVALVIFLLVEMCSPGSDAAQQNDGQKPTGNVSGSAGPSESPSGLAPIIGNGALPSTSGSPSPPPVASAPASATPSEYCADDEMQLTPEFRKIMGGSTPYELRLKIKNISSRTCKRDVGAKPQEMHIVSNGKTIWSTDSCQGDNPAPDVRTFGPNIEASFAIGWDGTQGTGCDNPGHPVAAGDYQLVARLDGKLSAPVPFTISGK